MRHARAVAVEAKQAGITELNIYCMRCGHQEVLRASDIQIDSDQQKSRHRCTNCGCIEISYSRNEG